MILLDAVYIHNYGGKSILDLLIRFLNDKNLIDSFYFLLDSRYKNSLNIGSRFKYLNASEKERRNFYKKNKLYFSRILCIANVPPPIKIKSPVLIYFHNDLLINYNEANFGLKSKLLFYLKFNYIRFKSQETYHWFVQTEIMKKKIFDKGFIKEDKIKIFPIYDIKIPSPAQKEKNTFLYVSNSMPHKNLKNLILAFVDISQKINFEIKLNLTSLKKDFINIDFERHKNLKIFWHGEIEKNKLETIYKRCEFLIYPSLKESFGLPLIEAIQHNCKILASDLPYVYEIIEPSLVFNPNCYKDISKTINFALHSRQLKESKIKIKNKLPEMINYINNIKK
tara:strand:- start:10201 stop:11214 length:1014 start_codon:yes stop_codon:yes gene_type:complete